MPPDTPTPEQEFLERLRQAAAAGVSSGLLSGSGGSLDAPGEIRCALADCPDPHAALTRPATAPIAPPASRLPAPPVWWLPNFVWRLLWHVWRFVREVSGDDAYERYLQHLARFHPGLPPMSRSDHFKFRQEQKWDRLSRCC